MARSLVTSLLESPLPCRNLLDWTSCFILQAMAGTRLVIHLSFLIQVVVLIASGAFFGLHLRKDLIFRPLYAQSGRKRLQLLSTQYQDEITVPVVKFTTDESQMVYWQPLLWKLAKKQHQTQTANVRVGKTFAVRSPEHELLLAQVCQDPTLPEASKSDVWICEATTSSSTEGKARMVVYNGTTVVYVRGKDLRHQDMEHVYPTVKSSYNTKTLLINVVTNRSHDWKYWRQALYQSLKRHDIAKWPCLRGDADHEPVQVNFVTHSLQTRSVTSSNNETSYLIDIDDVRSRSLSLTNDDNRQSTITLSILIPQDSPVKFVDEQTQQTSNKLLLGDKRSIVAIVESDSIQNDSLSVKVHYQDRIDAALANSVRELFTQCMGIDYELDLAQMDSIDGTFSSWHYKVWRQYQLVHLYHVAVAMVEKERQLLLDSPRRVWISDKVADRWESASNMIRHAQTVSLLGQFSLAAEYLEQAIEQIKSIQKDPDLLQPLDFPPVQYAAVFAPLLLPLVLPLVAGLGREMRRYNKLKKG